MSVLYCVSFTDCQCHFGSGPIQRGGDKALKGVGGGRGELEEKNSLVKWPHLPTVLSSPALTEEGVKEGGKKSQPTHILAGYLLMPRLGASFPGLVMGLLVGGADRPSAHLEIVRSA